MRSSTLSVLLQASIDYIFGFDFFIAYTRRDGGSYATSLAEELRRRGFRCFLDMTGFGVGDPLAGATHRALRKTTALALIGSPRVCESSYVLNEVTILNDLGRKIVPIDIAGTLENAEEENGLRALLGDRIRINEDIGALEKGPSDEVVGAILQSFKVIRQDTKRIRVLGVAAIFFAITAAVAVFFALQANAATRLAEDRRREAETRREEAETQRRVAQQNAEEALKQRLEAERQQKEVELQKSIAEKNEAEAIQNAEEARKQKEQVENERAKIQGSLNRADTLISVQSGFQRTLFRSIDNMEKAQDRLVTLLRDEASGGVPEAVEEENRTNKQRITKKLENAEAERMRLALQKAVNGQIRDISSHITDGAKDLSENLKKKRVSRSFRLQLIDRLLRENEKRAKEMMDLWMKQR